MPTNCCISSGKRLDLMGHFGANVYEIRTSAYYF